MGFELLAGLIIGTILGLTGAGGSVFALPMLVYGLNVPIQSAIGISLGAVAVSATVGMLARLNKGVIVWVPAIVVALTGMCTAPLGIWASRQIPDHFLLLGFSILVFCVAYRMWRESFRAGTPSPLVKKALQQSEPVLNRTYDSMQSNLFKDAGVLSIDKRCLGLVAVVGLFTGFLAGLFGVGGGFVIVPTLIILLELSIHQSIATSLVVIMCIGGTGFATFISGQEKIPLNILAYVACGGIAGMIIGTFVSRYISAAVLQKIFVYVISSVAIFTLCNSILGIQQVYF